MYSTYKLNKHGDIFLTWYTHFLTWNQPIVPYSIITFGSWPTYRFLRRQIRWSGILITVTVFPQLVVIHTVKGFCIVNKAEVGVFLEFSCFFYLILAIWSLLALPFLNPAWTYGISQFKYCLRLDWRITLVACEMTATVWWLNILWNCLSLVLEWKRPFPSCGHYCGFQICWHIECSTITASSLRIWNNSTAISWPPLALFIVMFLKAHLICNSGCLALGEWFVIIWAINIFLVQLFYVFIQPLLNSFCFC